MSQTDKCRTCNEVIRYVYDISDEDRDVELCSDCISRHAQQKPDYYVKEN